MIAIVVFDVCVLTTSTPLMVILLTLTFLSALAIAWSYRARTSGGSSSSEWYSLPLTTIFRVTVTLMTEPAALVRSYAGHARHVDHGGRGKRLQVLGEDVVEQGSRTAFTEALDHVRARHSEVVQDASGD